MVESVLTADHIRVHAAAAYTAQPVSWLWPGWLANGVLALLDGDPAAGKTTLTLELAARISRGFVAPDAVGQARKPAGVLLLSAQDEPETVLLPRLQAAGADLKRVFLFGGWAGIIKESATFAEIVATNEIALVVIDPLQAFLAPDQGLTNEARVRRALYPLQKLAAQTGTCVLLVRRSGRSQRGPALYRGEGSLAVAETCWSALVVGKDPGEPQLRVLAVTKCKGGPRPASLRFTLETRGLAVAVAWQGPCAWTADEAVANLPLPQAEAMSRVDDCARYIQSVLARPMPSKDLVFLCRKAGFAEITVERARKLLGVKAVRTSEALWEAALPEAANKQPTAKT